MPLTWTVVQPPGSAGTTVPTATLVVGAGGAEIELPTAVPTATPAATPTAVPTGRA